MTQKVEPFTSGDVVCHRATSLSLGSAGSAGLDYRCHGHCNKSACSERNKIEIYIVHFYFFLIFHLQSTDCDRLSKIIEFKMAPSVVYDERVDKAQWQPLAEKKKKQP